MFRLIITHFDVTLLLEISFEPCFFYWHINLSITPLQYHPFNFAIG